MHTQDCSPLGWTGWISFKSRGLSRVISNTTVQKHQFFGAQLSLMVQLWHQYMTTGKTIALTRGTFAGKVMSLLFNMLSRFIIAFLPGRKHLLISWLQSPSSVILEPKKIKSVTVFIVSPSICHEVMRPDADLIYLTIKRVLRDVLCITWMSDIALPLCNNPMSSCWSGSLSPAFFSLPTVVGVQWPSDSSKVQWGLYCVLWRDII